MIEGFELIEDALECDENATTDNVEISKIEDLGEEQQISSKKYSKIFDTEYDWSIPYVIDVKKYKEAAIRTRLTKDCKTRTVDFTCDIRKGCCNKLCFTLFVFAKDYDNLNDDYHYDCFQFEEGRDSIVNGETKKCTVETFIEKVKELTGAIISIDKEYIKEMISNKEQKKRIIQSDIDLLTNLIYNINYGK